MSLRDLQVNSWDDFKALVIAKSLVVNYAPQGDGYVLAASDGSLVWNYIIYPAETAAKTEFETTYEPTANKVFNTRVALYDDDEHGPADILPSGQLVTSIADPEDADKKANVVYVPADDKYALRVVADLTSVGSALAILNRANRIETNKLITSGSGYHQLLDLTVPSGYTWYLKGVVIATGKDAEWKLDINTATKAQGRLDATDSLEIQLYGFEVLENIDVDFHMNCGATNQPIYATLIIYEQENL